MCDEVSFTTLEFWVPDCHSKHVHVHADRIIIIAILIGG